jgi:hypothetical protein
MRRVAVLATVLLLVTAGCVSSTGSPETNVGGDSDPTTDDPTTDGPETLDTGDRTFETTDCSDAIEGVSFYGLNEAGRLGLWTPGQAAVGYTLKANASVFLVAYANGTRLGVEHASTVGYDHGVTADGDAAGFDRTFDDRQSIRVVAHRDVDRDGEFDPDTDLACEDGDGLVSTGVRVIDFGALDEATTAEGSATE